MSDAAQLNIVLTGRYRVEREIGAGGMATVYLAHDLRHDRQVALKVLRPELSAIVGPERFLNEIRTTAKLQHPHILPLHDSGEAGGLVFYVMPFVAGESLRQRLKRETQLPIDDALRIAREVASALDYAHRHGVIHRDIKPENILLHDGQAFVADFGIALAVSAVGAGTRMTETGMSLGTPHYMSPEQAMGEREITARSDVYALGCVLYEMLLGEPPFTGPTAQAIVARVVTEEPRSLVAQRKTIPPHVEAAVWTALAKLPADRFATAAEFAAALSAPGYAGAGQAHPRQIAPGRKWHADRRTIAMFAVVATLVAALVVTALWSRRTMGAAGGAVVTRLVIAPPDSIAGLVYTSLDGQPAVSPDGRVVAYSLKNGDTTALFVQPLDRFESWSVAGGGRQPFFSPDGKWIGFVRGNTVWKVGVDHGVPIRLGALDEAVWHIGGRGTWHPNGQIYFTTLRGLIAIPSTGGTSRMVIAADSSGQNAMRTLSLAPDGRLLGSVLRDRKWRLAVVSTDHPEIKLLPDNVPGPGWFVGKILVFAREEQFYAAHFDLGRLALIGEPVALTDMPNAQIAEGATAAWVDPAAALSVEPVWVTRTGQSSPTGLLAGEYRWPRLSPDGHRVALRRGGELITVVDLRTTNRVRLIGPNGASGRTEPVWFGDGRRVMTSATPRNSEHTLVTQLADASQPPDTVLRPTADEKWPTDISSGDSLALFYGTAPGDQSDIFVLDLRSKQQRRIANEGAQTGGRFSPNGRWIVYESRDAGASEIVVQPWPALDGRNIVSSRDGGDNPIWSRDGRELYYRSGERVMVVKVPSGGTWGAGTPTELFRGPYARDPYGDQSFDVAPDGRFLMLRYSGNTRVQVRVIQNWSAELEKKLADAKGR